VQRRRAGADLAVQGLLDRSSASDLVRHGAVPVVHGGEVGQRPTGLRAVAFLGVGLKTKDEAMLLFHSSRWAMLAGVERGQVVACSEIAELSVFSCSG
jgi:hypothetical protein